MKQAYRHRTALGVWINDMRNEGMPGAIWPCEVFDDRTVDDLIDCLELQHHSGFNALSIFGLLTTYGWPVDLATVADETRRRRVNQVLDAAHQRDIKVLYGLGVYSWGFDEIIEADQKVRGTNHHAMCASSAQSWEWMKKVVDFVCDQYDVDGFHLEPADQGRCSCSSCIKQGDIEYFCRISHRTAQYIRSRWPQKMLMVNMCGFMRQRTVLERRTRQVVADELPYLIELGNEIDFLIDPGHAGTYIPADLRADLLDRLVCDFGTSGGLWVYPPQAWDRLRWFLPHPMQTAKLLKDLYGAGARAIEYYMGPTVNPGVEMNIAFGGHILSDINRDADDVLKQVIEMLYKPRNQADGDHLAEIFCHAESAYFDHWSPQMKFPFGKRGEMHLQPLWDPDGPVCYLAEDFQSGDPLMDPSERAAYKNQLQHLLPEVKQLDGQFDDNGRIRRIAVCIKNVLADIDTFTA